MQTGTLRGWGGRAWAFGALLALTAGGLAGPWTLAAAAQERALGPSSRRTPLTISEIHYHPAPWDGPGNLEFITLRNTEPVPYDLSGSRLRGSIQYTFPAGTEIPPLDEVVVAADPAALIARYGLASALGPWSGNLPNSGGTVRFENAGGATLLEVAYRDDPPWPVAADGHGHSLTLTAPDFGEASPLAWSASSAFGGSPGSADPPRPAAYGEVRINEIHTHSDPALGFVELYNASTQAVDLAGFALCDEPDGACFVFPTPSPLPAGGQLARTHQQLGFAPNPRGDDLFLMAPDRLTVLDATRFGPQAPGDALGRHPDGAPEFVPLHAPTPNAPNAPPRIGPVVINEIMYRPMDQPDRGEYVELLNIGTGTVDVSGWRFIDGIDFTIPEGIAMAPGGFLVIARDAAFLIARHLHLNPSNTLGDFSGALSDGGERLALARPLSPGLTNSDHVVVNALTYRDDAAWGLWTDGGGSSLELTDPRADNRLAAHWAGSDETHKALWTTLAHTGDLRNGSGTSEQFDLFLHRAGEALVDNVELIREGETINRLAPAQFDGGLDGWTPLGNHLRSVWAPGRGEGGSGALHLRASGPGRTTTSSYLVGHYDRVWKPLDPEPAPGEVYTIRLRARWQAGWPYLAGSLKGFWLEAAGRLHVPANLGTPGLPNSRYATNAPPAIGDLEHHPILPAAGEPIRVFTRVADPDGLGPVTLRYRLDPDIAYTDVPMVIEGPGGSGRHVATIPGQNHGTLVAFHVQAADLAVPPRTRRHPEGDLATDALVRVGDARAPSVFGRYHVWVSTVNRTALAARHNQSNEPVDATFVYNGHRVIYNATLRYRGNHRNFGSLTNAAYALEFPAGERFLGDRESKIDIPSLQFSNQTRQQERHGYGLTEAIGEPAPYLRYVRVHVNGSDLFRHDLQGPTRDFARSWYGDDDPHLYKEEKPLDPFGNYTNTAGAKTQATYAFLMQKNRTRVPAYDYGAFYRLVDALAHPDEPVRNARVAALADPRGVAVYFAGNRAAGNVDSYGYGAGFLHNLYAYVPPLGRARLHLYDLDSAFTAPPITQSAQWFPSAEAPGWRRVFASPGFEREYWRLLRDYAEGPLRATHSDARLDAWHQAFTQDGLGFLSADAVDPNTGLSMRQWIAQRRTQMLNALTATNAAAAFTVTTHGGADFATPQRLVTVSGQAPVTADTLWVNGLKARPAWITPIVWQLTLGLEPGANPFQFEARAPGGDSLGGAALTITCTGAAVSPVGQVIFSEIMDRPAAPRGEYVEIFNRSATEAFELGGWRIDAVDYTFKRGVVIAPRGRLVVAEDTPAYAAAYGNPEVLAGDYGGSLADEGEPIRLLAPAAGGGEQVVNALHYQATPPWPVPDGPGAALQAIDLFQDNRLPGNWRRVARPRPWTFTSLTGTATLNFRTIAGAEARLFLGGPGEAVVDRVMLVTGTVAEAGVNLLANGGFEAPTLAPWTAPGNHARSRRDTDDAYEGAAGLRLIATDRGLGDGHAVRQGSLGLATGGTYTLSFWYRPTDAVATLIAEVSQTDIRWEPSLAPPAPVEALATPGTSNSVAATLPPLPPVWINEVLPLNPGPLADAFGETEPWVELWNGGTGAVSLAGLYLGRDPAAPKEWALPADAVLAPGEHLLIWMDGETHQTTPGSLHGGFRLDAPTGQVLLSVDTGTAAIVLDAFVYAAMAPGVSIGVTTEGDPLTRTLFSEPTPGAPNGLAMPLHPVRINEWMAENTRIPDPADGRFPDWFELYNPNPFALSLAGYRLTDTLNSLNKFVIPPGITIPAHGFLVVWADDETEQTVPPDILHVNFKLDKGGELIRLAAPDGTLADLVVFGSQELNRAEGRWPDGAAAIHRMSPATPGAPNQVLEVRQTAVISNQGFRVAWSAEPGRRYAIDASPTLIPTNWWPMGLVTATTAVAVFDDPDAGGLTQRVYRIRDAGP